MLLTTFVYRRPPHTGQTGARADHSKSGRRVWALNSQWISVKMARNMNTVHLFQNRPPELIFCHSVLCSNMTGLYFPKSLNSLIIFLLVTILQIVRHITFDTINNIFSQYGSLQISSRLKILVSFHWQPWSGKFRAFWNFWRLDSKLYWQVTRSNLPRRTKCHWVDEYFPSFCCINLAKMQ